MFGVNKKEVQSPCISCLLRILHCWWWGDTSVRDHSSGPTSTDKQNEQQLGHFGAVLASKADMLNNTSGQFTAVPVATKPGIFGQNKTLSTAAQQKTET